MKCRRFCLEMFWVDEMHKKELKMQTNSQS